MKYLTMIPKTARRAAAVIAAVAAAGLLARRTRLHGYRADPGRRGHAILTRPVPPAGSGPRAVPTATSPPVPGRTPGSHAWSAAGTRRTAGRRRSLASTIRPAPAR